MATLPINVLGKVHRLCQAAGEQMYGWNARGELILYCPICHPDNVAAQEAKQTIQRLATLLFTRRKTTRFPRRNATVCPMMPRSIPSSPLKIE